MKIAKYALIAISLFTLLGTSFAVHAKVKFKVRNCGDEKMLVCVFNGKDSVRMFEADFSRLGVNSTATLKCAGQGKGGCKVRATLQHTSHCDSSDMNDFSGNHKGYYILHDKYDLEEVSESEYNKDCD